MDKGLLGLGIALAAFNNVSVFDNKPREHIAKKCIKADGKKKCKHSGSCNGYKRCKYAKYEKVR